MFFLPRVSFPDPCPPFFRHYPVSFLALTQSGHCCVLSCVPFPMRHKESLNAVKKRMREEQRKRTALRIGELMLAEREQLHQEEDEDQGEDECMRQLREIRDLLQTVTWRVNIIVLLLIFFVVLAYASGFFCGRPHSLPGDPF